MVPVALHGASNKTTSNFFLLCHLSASETIKSAFNPTLFKFWRTRFILLSDTSRAVTQAPPSANCIVLPPGAAQISKIFLLLISPSN